MGALLFRVKTWCLYPAKRNPIRELEASNVEAFWTGHQEGAC
jgi:hypothetical protein